MDLNEGEVEYPMGIYSTSSSTISDRRRKYLITFHTFVLANENTSSCTCYFTFSHNYLLKLTLNAGIQAQETLLKHPKGKEEQQ